jgi:hypothetical protein
MPQVPTGITMTDEIRVCATLDSHVPGDGLGASGVLPGRAETAGHRYGANSLARCDNRIAEGLWPAVEPYRGGTGDQHAEANAGAGADRIGDTIMRDADKHANAMRPVESDNRTDDVGGATGPDAVAVRHEDRNWSLAATLLADIPRKYRIRPIQRHQGVTDDDMSDM